MAKEETQKAYKLLANQENISNQEAKKYCDRGLVYVSGKKVKIARGEFPLNTVFKIQKTSTLKAIFEDENIIVLDKPIALTSDECAKRYKNTTLIHRLDKETSGILLLSKNEEFKKQIIQEFKDKKVYKEYIAIVFGVVNEDLSIDDKLLSIKKNNQILTRVSKNGKDALTHISPIEIIGKKTKLKVIIETGRTHQIRVHLANIGHPIVGDEVYGQKSRANRLMLHAHKISFLDYNFTLDPREDIAF